jgi:IMP cyclohydrolase
MGDGNPPAFEGDPIVLPLEGDAEKIANYYWQLLNPENRISLFVRELESSGEDRLKIINRF